MDTVQTGNVVFGEGRPKICLPIVADNIADILDEARKIKCCGFADVCEWRIDFYKDLLDENGKLCEDAILSAVKLLKEELAEIVLLVTFRSQKEGGQMELNDLLYENLLLMLAQTEYPDMLDVELSVGDALFSRMTKAIHSYNIKVIGSSHDFHETPANEEMTRRLYDMSRLGADICKLAVMPNSREDVIRLLNITFEMNKKSPQPIVTMSMGQLGCLSRLCGEFFGSAMTFGCLNKSSAPGQVDASKLSTVLDLLQLAGCED